MVKHRINKVQEQAGNNDRSKAKAKRKLVVNAQDQDVECTVSSSSAGGQRDNAARMARFENSPKEVALSVPAVAQPKDKELAHPTVPVAAQPKNGEVFVDGFLPVSSVKPEDGFLPIESFLATTAGLLPRTADHFAMDVILPLPDIPLIRRYILWHPPVEGFYFKLMPVEVWQAQTGANANILFKSFRLTGMPPLLWKTMCHILPPLVDED